MADIKIEKKQERENKGRIHTKKKWRNNVKSEIKLAKMKKRQNVKTAHKLGKKTKKKKTVKTGIKREKKKNR